MQRRCQSPLILMNNVSGSPPSTPAHFAPSPRLSPLSARGAASCVSPQPVAAQLAADQENQEPRENPFKYWQQQQQRQQAAAAADVNNDRQVFGQAPRRTTSLGPRRPFVVENLQTKLITQANNGPQRNEGRQSQSKIIQEIGGAFYRATRELQSSLTELDKIISSQKATSAADKARLARPPPKAIVEPPAENSPPVAEPRWQWKEDLDNWKLSTSMNDLRSVFESASSSNTLTRPIPNKLRLGPNDKASEMRQRSVSGTYDRPPAPACATVGGHAPEWTTSGGGSTAQRITTLAAVTSNQKAPVCYADYTIRRATSTLSARNASRPPLRNPYRGPY